MPDQRIGEEVGFWHSCRSDGGSSPPSVSPSGHQAAAGGSLESETYAILQAWSAVQLVVWEQRSKSWTGSVAKCVQTWVLDSSQTHCAHVFVAFAIPSSPVLHNSLSVVCEGKKISIFSPSTGVFRYRNTATHCGYHKSFKLLSSYTNIPPHTKKVCRLSETHKILEENIFFQVIYLSPFLRPHVSGSFHLPHRYWYPGFVVVLTFFICFQKKEARTQLSDFHSHIQPILQFAIHHRQTIFVHYSNDK